MGSAASELAPQRTLFGSEIAPLFSARAIKRPAVPLSHVPNQFKTYVRQPEYCRGLSQAACWIEVMGLDKGIDLAADFETPENFSHSLIVGMRFHTDFPQRLPNGLDDLAPFEVTEELFWGLMPRNESDYSAFESQRSGRPRLFQYLMLILRAVAGRGYRAP
jgi:hypothetical protein